VSIALEHAGEIILGTVYDPLKDELFTTLKGEGAYLNEHPIHISEVSEMDGSLITTGFPFRDKDQIDNYLKVFRKLFLEVSDIRRAGSAVLDLAYLASGRCDGFFEIRLFPWDLAAGGLLIEEAGGVVTDFQGGPDYIWTGNIVAGTPKVHKKILRAVRSVFEGVI
jgi:myo-inositol-1(or 4)-monophosphatase